MSDKEYLEFHRINPRKKMYELQERVIVITCVAIIVGIYVCALIL